MADRFEDAFGVRFGAPYLEIETLYKNRFGIDVCGHLAVFKGVAERDVETFLDAEGNEIADLSGTTYELSQIAMNHFLAQHRASKYNAQILDSIVAARNNLLLMRTMLANRQEFEALHFLLAAKSALGEASSLIEFRDAQREKGRKGGNGKGASTARQNRRIVDLYREKIPRGISLEQAAQDLQVKHGVDYKSHRHIVRVISDYRKKQEN